MEHRSSKNYTKTGLWTLWLSCYISMV